MLRQAQEGIGRGARLVALAGLAGLAGCVSPGPAPSVTNEKHFVWRVRDAAVPFYLVGTIHNLEPRDYPVPAIYERVLRDSRRLLFEYDPREHTALTKQFCAAAEYPPG